jgi:hypothetical protein
MKPTKEQNPTFSMTKNRPSEQNTNGILKPRIWLHNQNKNAPKPVHGNASKGSIQESP